MWRSLCRTLRNRGPTTAICSAIGKSFQLNDPDGSLSLTFVTINDRHYIELFPEKAPNTDRLNHISIEVEDAEGCGISLLLRYRGAGETGQRPDRNSNFNVKDPDRHTVEVMQYEPGGWTSRDKGKALDGGRISRRMMHVGILVGALEPAMKFYRDILGFEEIWRGAAMANALIG